MVVLFGLALLWMFTAPDNNVHAGTTSTTTATADSASKSSGDQSQASEPTSSKSSASSSSSTSKSPKDQLSNARKSSLQSLDLDSSYAVVLSAKFDGVTDDFQTTHSGSSTFHLPDILDLHRDLKNSYSSDGDVYLLTSTDLEGTSDIDKPNTVWMTVLDPGRLADKEDARDWCDSNFAGLSDAEQANSCAPVQLTSP